MSAWRELMASGRIDNDVFRWKCQAILEGLLEGATLEETKASLWEFVWAYAHGDAEDWSKLPYDAELCSRAIALLHKGAALSPRADDNEGKGNG